MHETTRPPATNKTDHVLRIEVRATSAAKLHEAAGQMTTYARECINGGVLSSRRSIAGLASIRLEIEESSPPPAAPPPLSADDLDTLLEMLGSLVLAPSVAGRLITWVWHHAPAETREAWGKARWCEPPPDVPCSARPEAQR